MLSCFHRIPECNGRTDRTTVSISCITIKIGHVESLLCLSTYGDSWSTHHLAVNCLCKCVLQWRTFLANTFTTFVMLMCYLKRQTYKRKMYSYNSVIGSPSVEWLLCQFVTDDGRTVGLRGTLFKNVGRGGQFCYTFIANLYWYLCAKDHQTRRQFDEVIAKIKGYRTKSINVWVCVV